LDELPDKGVKGAELLLDFEEASGVRNGALYLEAVADDAGVEQQLLDACRREARNPLRIEAGEGPQVASPPVQYS